MPTIPLFNRCSKCGNEYPATEKYFRQWRTFCRACERDAAREFYYNHREDVLLQKKEARESNPDHYRQHDRDQYYKHHDHQMARHKKYRTENPDKRRLAMLDWRVRNPDKVKDYSAQYYKEHPETVKANRDKRRARILNAQGEYTADDIKRLYEDQEGHCAYCGIGIFPDLYKDMHIDHVMPLSRGGSNAPDNLVLTCQPCNQSKSDKTVAEWRAVRSW
jgi:5-methylcytosine-specific restriction endonuclease McrA